jgi:hypothetical protein
MSWKATAYVKDLVKGISPTEKLLLFVLADYHNTVKRICWPSMKVLAEEALMSERNASRLLEALETKGILSRVVGLGRGNTTCYRFVALDGKDDNLAGFSDGKDDRKDDKNGVKGDTKDDKNRPPIRKEPVLEPVEPVNTLEPVRARPSLEDVKTYCKERKNSVDPEHWFDHYQSNGWKVGRTPMKDWRAAVRTWEHTSKNGNGNGHVAPVSNPESDIGYRLLKAGGLSPVDRSKEPPPPAEWFGKAKGT